MYCLYPVTKFYAGRALGLPCGQCIACRLNRQQAWVLRLRHEAEVYGTPHMVDLTYDEAHIPPTKELSYEDISKWIKRLRKFLSPHTKIRYFLAGEYGGQFQRPHYHCIVFGLPEERVLRTAVLAVTWGKCIMLTHSLVRSDAAYRYTTKYILKQGALVLMSKKLGWAYASQHIEEYIDKGYIQYKGKKWSIPRYYERNVDMFRLAQSKRERRQRYEEALRLKADKLCQSEYEYWSQRQKEIDQAELNLKAKHGG